MNALKLTNVSKQYSEFKLDNINLELPKGYIMGFVGENGAGKSTTIKLILDLIKRDSGSIEVLGEDNLRLSKEFKNKIGVVFDEPCFDDSLEYKQFNKIFKNLYTSWDEDKFNSYLDKFNIDKSKKFKEFSRGMKMKFSIAVALSHNAEILILDEATSGLDPVVRDEILELFFDFIQDPNHSIFISSHITSDLEKICDYITFIHKGKIIFTKTKDELSETYGILKCSKAEIEKLDESCVIGIQSNEFSTEALVYKKKLPKGIVTENASIEQIMLFYIKENKQ